MCLPQKTGMGHTDNSHRCYLHVPSHMHPVSNISQILSQSCHLPINYPTLWPSHGTTGVHQHSPTSKIDSFTTRNRIPPISGPIFTKLIKLKLSQKSAQIYDCLYKT